MDRSEEFERTKKDLLRYAGRGYRVILADPPWPYRNFSGDRASTAYGSANAHYKTDLTVGEIASLPIPELIDPDGAVLFLWVTCPNLPNGLKVMQGWGFEFKTVAFAWVKTRKLKKESSIGYAYGTEVCPKRERYLFMVHRASERR